LDLLRSIGDVRASDVKRGRRCVEIFILMVRKCF
jgi:hypothetical protein